MSSKYRSVSSRYLATYVVERFSLGNIGISGDWTSKNGISCLLSTTPCLLSTVVSFKYRIVSSRYRSVSSRYHFVSFKYQEVLWALLPYGFAGSSLYNLYNLYTYTEEKNRVFWVPNQYPRLFVFAASFPTQIIRSISLAMRRLHTRVICEKRSSSYATNPQRNSTLAIGYSSSALHLFK